MVEVTIGLTKLLLIAGTAITLAIAIIRWVLEEDWTATISVIIIGGILTTVFSPLFNYAVKTGRAKKAAHAERLVYVAEQRESMPAAWQKILRFMQSEESPVIRSSVISRFVMDKSVPPITLNQHDVFIDEIPCNGFEGLTAATQVNCERWKMFIAEQTSPFVEFNMEHVLLQTEAPPGMELVTKVSYEIPVDNATKIHRCYANRPYISENACADMHADMKRFRKHTGDQKMYVRADIGPN